MRAYTPKPWIVGGEERTEDHTRDILVEPWGQGNGWNEIALNVDTEANANLMAAAPELYESLKWAMRQGNLTYMGRTKANGEYCDAVDAANAAIAKVEVGS